eukprot:3550458-Amphidinium_carterae.1
MAKDLAVHLTPNPRLVKLLKTLRWRSMPNITTSVTCQAVLYHIEYLNKSQIESTSRVMLPGSNLGVPACSAPMRHLSVLRFLLFCEVQLFKEFGQMLVVNMLYSLAFALVWLPSVLEALNLCTPDPSSRYAATDSSLSLRSQHSEMTTIRQSLAS